MESELIKKCQSHQCDAAAVKHVRFGLRIHDVAGLIGVSEIPYVAEYFDLCEEHIADVQNNYFHVNEYDLCHVVELLDNAQQN